MQLLIIIRLHLSFMELPLQVLLLLLLHLFIQHVHGGSELGVIHWLFFLLSFLDEFPSVGFTFGNRLIIEITN